MPMESNAEAARAIVGLYYMLEQQDELTSPDEWGTLLKRAIVLGKKYPRYGKCLFKLQTFIFRAMQESTLEKNNNIQFRLLQAHVQAISNGLQER